MVVVRRESVLRVRVTAQQLAELDAAAHAAGLTRSRYVRSLITGSGEGASAVPSRREAIDLLAAKARGGNIQAIVALERALQLAEEPAPLPIRSGPVELEEARAELRVVR
jgi:hypothetical protein